MTVYRRPDPIPLNRNRPTAGLALGQVRPDQEDLHYLVARRIFLAIASGAYPEGSILPTEQALAEELRVSRTALREAIKGLTAKGLLETRRRRGTLVLHRSRWNLLDADVIEWLRREDSRAVSEELWETVVSLLPSLASVAASRGAVASLAHARLPKGETELEARTEFLVEIARLAGNRFALSVITRAMQSLLVGDSPFLDAATRGLTADAGRKAAVALRDGDKEQVARILVTALQPSLDTVLA